jgi:hypothetical protein
VPIPPNIRSFDYFTNKLTGNKLAGGELSTLSQQKITNNYTKFQVDEIGQMISVWDELHVFMD